MKLPGWVPFSRAFQDKDKTQTIEGDYVMNGKWKRACAVAVAIIFMATSGIALASRGGKIEIKPGSIPVENQKRLEYPQMAKIGPEEAIRVASEKTNGKVMKLSLEKRKGFLVYVVKTVTPEKKVMKVIVDAGNGTVLGQGEAVKRDGHRKHKHGGEKHHGKRHHGDKNAGSENTAPEATGNELPRQ
jgi:uncharacterized membrane protein YkoI